MKYRLRKITSIFLAVIMIFGVLTVAPFTVSAAGTANDIINVARGEVGVSGQPNKYTYWLGTINGSYSYAWCHAFVSWCANQAGAGDKLPKTASCATGVNWFKNRGEWKSRSSGYIPKAGDIIYFDYGSNGTYDHVGIVTSSSGGRVYTIEGNARNAVKVNGGYSNGYSLSSTDILGYGTPLYSNPNPPTNVYLDKNQYWYDIQDTITLYPHADGATYYWLSVYKGDNHIVDTCIYSEYSFSASQWGYGNYYAWITAANSAGGTDSEGINFSVVEAPKYSNINSSKPIYDVDDTVSITVDSVCAKGQCVGIDKDGVGRVVTESCDSTFTISASNLGIGSYSAYFTIWNGSGSVDTKRINFYISERENLGDEFYAYIRHQGSGLYLTNQLSDEFGNVVGKEHTCEKNQAWKFTRLSNGAYKICSTVDDSCIDIRGGEDVNAANVITFDYYGNSNQQFYVYYQYGAYYFRPTHSSTRVLDMSSDTNNLEIWRMEADWTPQKFEIEKIEQSEIGIHKYMDKVVAPTTDSEGYTEHICSICGYSYKDSYTHLMDIKSDGYNITLFSNSYTYDGTAKTPTVTVKNNTATLAKDTDYTVEYSNNINAGTATVTVTGIGNYTGTLTKTFTINKAPQTINATISLNTINIGDTSKITASGQGTISYSSSNNDVATVSSSGVVTGISAGTATITVTATGNSNYKSASKTITVSIQKLNVSSEGFGISLSSGSYTYDGTAKIPTLTVKNDIATLAKDTDYTVEYSNNINAGTATVTVTGIGNYTGTLTKTFTINKAPQTINATISLNTINIGDTSKITASGQGTISYSSSNNDVATVSSSGVVTGISAGTATITVTAAGNSNYNSVSKTISVSIEKSFLSGDVNSDGKITIDDVTLVHKYLASVSDFTTSQKDIADVNNDGDISIDDVTLMQKYIAGIITKLG